MVILQIIHIIWILCLQVIFLINLVGEGLCAPPQKKCINKRAIRESPYNTANKTVVEHLSELNNGNTGITFAKYAEAIALDIRSCF